MVERCGKCTKRGWCRKSDEERLVCGEFTLLKVELHRKRKDRRSKFGNYKDIWTIRRSEYA